jgi:hypothetical protein
MDQMLSIFIDPLNTRLSGIAGPHLLRKTFSAIFYALDPGFNASQPSGMDEVDRL